MTRYGLAALLAALAVGCDDGGGSVGGDGQPPPEAALMDQAVPDAAPMDQAVQDAAPPLDQAPPPDQGPPADMAPDQFVPECRAGEAYCADEGQPERVVCEAGRLVLSACPAGQICVGEGDCIPDPAECVDGDRICLDARTPARCEPGSRWTPARVCPEGTACSGRGECRSVACATNEESQSYLGCDYQAIDLPNLAFAELGATADAPLGIVLTNPDEAESVRVTVRGPDGRLAALVGEVTIEPPPTALGEFEPVTVRSEVRGPDGVITQAFEEAAALEVPPGGLATLLLPHQGWDDRGGVRLESWRVSSDRPVAAYQFSPYCCNFSYTNDASLLLPVGALGTTYRNVGVPAWKTDDEDRDGNPVEGPGYPATLTVIGTQPGTRVTVTLPAGVQVDPDPTMRSQRNGQVLSAVLGDSEVWTIEASESVRVRGAYVGQDLSGARVEATAPVAVFTGHQCTFYPQDSAACDHLEEQLFPVDAWGAEFLLTPPKLRTQLPGARETTYWKLVADTDATRITLGVPFAELQASPPGSAGVPDCGQRLTGPDEITLQAGEFCEFGTRRPVSARATAPVQIMGIMSGQASVGFNLSPNGANAGDPAIWIVPPQRQFRRSYAFLAPDTYFVDYVTVVAPVGTELTLDGQPVDMVGAERVAGADQFFVQAIEIEDGPHRIEGTAPFGILVYAYDDYVSYAFTGGLDLSKR